MDSTAWDRRYADSDLLWSAAPNRWVEEVAVDMPTGRALDLAAGEGRNALWLAERGWMVTAVDFSAVALARARSLAVQRLGDRLDRLDLVKADLSEYVPAHQGYDLVIIAYLQVGTELRRRVLQRAADAVTVGGLLLVVAHDSSNLGHGVGGPQDPAVLYTAQDAASDIDGRCLEIVSAETRARKVSGDGRERAAIDAFLLAHHP